MKTDEAFEEGTAGTKSGRKNDPTKEYEANEPMSPAKIKEHEPMSPAKIKEHEPTAVSRDNTSSSDYSSGQDPKERLRRSGMTEGTAGSTETGDQYEQGAAGTNK